MKVSRNIKKILSLLKTVYGVVPKLRRSPPVDVLIRTILSQNTQDKNSLKAFSVLKKNFGSWEDLLNTDTRSIARLIRHAGLSNIKAERLKEALGGIKKRFGKISLALLKRMALEGSSNYLMSLKGVGPKTAACVMLFGFGKEVLPVDTHIFRVSKRLGLINKRLSIKEAHQVLSAIVPKTLIYEFHLGIIEHGRRTCKAQNPKCGICVLYDLCQFEKKLFFKRMEEGIVDTQGKRRGHKENS